MSERKSKYGGDAMKRLIALLLAVVFCVTLFPTAAAYARDPRLDLVSPDEVTDPDEEHPWNVEKSNSPTPILSLDQTLWWLTIVWVIDIPDRDTNSSSTNIDESNRTAEDQRD